MILVLMLHQYSGLSTEAYCLQKKKKKKRKKNIYKEAINASFINARTFNPRKQSARLCPTKNSGKSIQFNLNFSSLSFLLSLLLS